MLAGTSKAHRVTTSQFSVSAYCPCKICCGKWAGGPTKSGRMPKAGVTIAAPRSIELGTWLHIAGLGKRRVDDRLAPEYDHRIDVFFSKHQDAVQFGIQTLTVTQ